MKPLTIEELKALEVGDWVWIDDGICKGYRKITLTSVHGMCLGASDSLNTFRYRDYGKTWLAYKNKEQAEGQYDIKQFAENVGSKIAGHSDYHGDNILSALYCAAEGEKIKDVKPIERKGDLYKTAFELILQDVYETRLQADVLSCSSCPFMANIFDECQNQGLHEDCKRRWQEYYLKEAERRLAELKGKCVL